MYILNFARAVLGLLNKTQYERWTSHSAHTHSPRLILLISKGVSILVSLHGVDALVPVQSVSVFDFR